MRRLIIGDIHGQYNRMIEVLNCAHFNPEEDELYPLGDFCDRGPKPVEVLDYIYSLPHCYPVLGNHDVYLMEYLTHTIPVFRLNSWITKNNGGWNTLKTVDNQSYEWQKRVIDKLLSTPFVRRADDNIILHGGISIELMETYTPEDFIDKTRKDITDKEYMEIYDEIVWDRSLIKDSMEKGEIDLPWRYRFIVGHTPIRNNGRKPYISSSIIDVDTASFDPSGSITVMDIDTLEYWQSTLPVETVSTSLI